MCLHRFNQLDPSILEGRIQDIRRCLSDTDPSVMGASLHLIYDLAKRDVTMFRDITPSLLTILHQVKDHKLPTEYDYHRIPAPWFQMQLLKILAVIGTADQAASEKMYGELLDVLKRADVDSNIGDAIVYEAIRTIAKIYPNDTLLNNANQAIGKFINSKNNNLKYLGINSLTYMVRISPKYVMQYQSSVMNSLEDIDDSIKVKTLDLLYEMCNNQNLHVIVSKMFKYLEETTDEYIRKDIVQRISQLSERFAPNPSWYITTMTQLFQIGGNSVAIELAENMMSILSEGQGDSSLDLKLRTDAANSYYQLLDKPKLAVVIKQLGVWIVGEYGHLIESGPEECIKQVIKIFEREGDVLLRCYCLTALLKLCISYGSIPESLTPLLNKCSVSTYVELQSRAFLIKSMMSNLSVAKNVITPGQNDDVEVFSQFNEIGR